MQLKECIDVWLSGCKELLITDTILVLAWSSGTVMEDLGTGAYISNVVGDSIPGILIPVILFLVSCLVAFSTGTSYGTSAIMIPIAFPLAWGVTGGEMDTLCLVTIAAVTSGSIFGDHCSPISDTTIMSSMGSAADLIDHVRTQLPYAVTVAVVASLLGYLPADHCSPISDTTIMSSMGSAADLIDHVRTQLPYAVTVAVVASLLGYLPAAAGISPLILIPVGIAALVVVVRVLGKSTKLEDLQAEEEKSA